MDLMNMILKQAVSGDNLAQLAEKTGISEDKLPNAIEASLPAIMEGLNQNSNTKSGAEALDKALDKHDGSILDSLANGDLSGIDLGDGAKILGHIFGDAEGDVEDELGKEAGISSGQSADLMSALAPLVLGALGKEKQDGGLGAMAMSALTTQLVSSFLGDDSNSSSKDSGLMGLITGVLGSAAKDADDSILDDILLIILITITI